MNEVLAASFANAVRHEDIQSGPHQDFIGRNYKNTLPWNTPNLRILSTCALRLLLDFLYKMDAILLSAPRDPDTREGLEMGLIFFGLDITLQSRRLEYPSSRTPRCRRAGLASFRNPASGDLCHYHIPVEDTLSRCAFFWAKYATSLQKFSALCYINPELFNSEDSLGNLSNKAHRSLTG